MSEHEQSLSPHTSMMAAAVTGMGGLSPPSSTSSTSTPNSSAQATSGSQRLGALESIAGELYGLSTPIFPPTTFDLPDISFSNSVNSSSTGGGMFVQDHHGMFDGGNGGQLMGDLTISSHNSHHQQHSSHHQQQLQIQQSLQQIQQQQQLRQHQGMGQFPPAACSPHGTSSSDDSDDLPLAQLAKRQAFPSTAITTTVSSTSVSEEKIRSGSNSPNNSTTTSTTTITSSTVSAGAAPKKAKPSKRKKKKDPNEPQKPVSAYALFFRDTQATIKGHNPSASFGEVSKIVASMWDQLDPEHKDVYKKKTETAKKQYLKQLAAYRASQVSQSASDETEKSPSPPTALGVSPPQTMGGNMMSLSPNQQPMGNTGFAGGPIVSPPHIGSPVEEKQQIQHQAQQQQPQQQMMQMSPQHQMMQQQQHHMMQQQMQQQHMQQMQQQQQQMMTMSDQLTGISSPPQHQQQHHTPPQQHDPTSLYNEFTEPPREMDLGYPHCVRMGCTNQARENPAWDSQYCSNDCVITHCRDIFTTWVSARSGSNSFPVK